MQFFESRLTPKTVALARVFAAVSKFVNDVLDEDVLPELAGDELRVVAMRRL